MSTITEKTGVGMDKKTEKSIIMILCMAVGMVFLVDDIAEARRMGGGRSFGSKPSYNRSTPNKAPASSPTKSNPAAPATAPRSGLGGMMGGFLMGGLIGSMLFGGGHGFGGPGLFDLLLIGGGLFLLFRYLKSKKMATASPGGGAAMFDRESPGPMGGGGGGWGSGNFIPSGASSASPAVSYPPGFDPEEFLKGATAIYTRLQNAWDKRDLQDIRVFTSPEVFSEIQDQARQDPTPGKTELLLINPGILEVRDVDNQTIVSVRYDVTLREDTDAVAKQVLELWHFSRNRNNPDDFWILEGIQQME